MAGPEVVRRGQSIAFYRREDLVALVRWIGEGDASLEDEQVVEAARRLLQCPQDEEMLVGARLRFAVSVWRERPE